MTKNKTSVGLAYLISDDNNEVCQVWVGDESDIIAHCQKYDFSWERIPIFETSDGMIDPDSVALKRR